MGNEIRNQELRECQKCWWRWFQRKEGTPLSCPRCQSLSWQVPFAEGEAKREYYGKAKMKFPVDQIVVGEAQHFPWIKLENGGRDYKANKNRVVSIRAWAKRNGREFYITPVPDGIWVKRIA